MYYNIFHRTHFVLFLTFHLCVWYTAAAYKLSLVWAMKSWVGGLWWTDVLCRLKPTRSNDEEQRYPVSIRDNIDIWVRSNGFFMFDIFLFLAVFSNETCIADSPWLKAYKFTDVSKSVISLSETTTCRLLLCEDKEQAFLDVNVAAKLFL